ncbi:MULTISPECIES: carbohydrate ABC transporter permease [Helcobacillus]|uniref:carbohydrate ABC transporter permease n=1 Tax=Helcobacillus TaxID=1161125 RepID=UPI002955CD7B|nr:sugar ABC transporter permease [Helcobacillus massiliensis]WOO92095.1 sugar ABC transporter permease [Helcobacillus massiliensis]
MMRSRSPWTAWLLVAPATIGVVAFILLPVLVAFGLSLTNWQLVGGGGFVGLENYRALLTGGALLNSLVVTALFTLMSVPVAMALGLLLAMQLNRALPGAGVFRVIVVIPWVCAPLAIGVVFSWIYQPSYGALNAILGRRVEWLTDPSLALPSVAFVAIWQAVGYIALFYQAGLQKIPSSIYEAAELDGAGPLRRLWSITLPLLRPTTFFVALTQIVASFQVFDTVYALTGGGPGRRTEVIASLIYSEAFTSYRMGRASAIAVILFVILALVAIVQQRYFSSRITYDMS